MLLLLLVPAVFVLPYKNLGARDAEGNRFYRAYFTADFIWHMALTAELTKYAMPPVNPYVGDRTIQYYWTYFLVPAVISEEGVGGLQEIENSLKVNALCSGVLFIAALILVTWAASLSAVGTAFAIVLAVVAASAEGLYAWWELYSRGRPLEGLTSLNIDAMSNWRFSGLRVDSLVRSMWYNPQHSMSAALGLLAMPIAGAAGVSAPIGAIVFAGLALALSTTFNPLIGGLFSLIYGAVILVDAVRTRQIRPVLHHTIAAALVGLAVGWCVSNDMVEGAAAVVVYGLTGYAQNRPVATLMLSLGPLVVPAVLGLWPPWGLPRHAWPAVAGTVVGLLVFYLVRLSVEDSYIGFRAGQLLQLALPGLAALFFARIWLDVARGRRQEWKWRAAAATIAVALIVIGLPTTLIDTYNAQDIGNLGKGPGGFRWTVPVTPDEQEAYRWMRTETPRDAIVQMDPIAHGRETWSQLPTFAERRMAAARPISLMDIPDYAERSRTAHRIYAERNAETAVLARTRARHRLHLHRRRRSRSAPVRGSLAKFDRRPDLFRRVFVNTRTRIYEIAACAVIFSSGVLVPVSIVAISTGIVAVIIAGPWALAYIPLYVLATVPGWPLGRPLFGTHPAAWVAGALLGYAFTCIAFWAVLALHVPSALTFVLAWAMVSAATLVSLVAAAPLRRDDAARLPLPALELSPDARTLVLLLLLVPAVFVLPYKILAHAMLTAIVITARTSPPISSGTWR